MITAVDVGQNAETCKILCVLYFMLVRMMLMLKSYFIYELIRGIP